jgi:hypothetical protein
MVALTNSQFLPYQTGSDRRCDAPDVWRDFLAQFEQQFVPLSNLAARLASPPIAVVERRTPWDVATLGSSGGQVQFDTVVIDTDNMVNLDFDNRSVTPQRPGWYIGYGWIRALKSQIGVGDLMSVSFTGGFAGNASNRDSSDPVVALDPITLPMDDNQSLDVYTSVGKPWFPTEAGAGVPQPWTLQKGGDNASSYDFAQMAVIWIADV